MGCFFFCFVFLNVNLSGNIFQAAAAVGGFSHNLGSFLCCKQTANVPLSVSLEHQALFETLAVKGSLGEFSRRRAPTIKAPQAIPSTS